MGRHEGAVTYTCDVCGKSYACTKDEEYAKGFEAPVGMLRLAMGGAHGDWFIAIFICEMDPACRAKAVDVLVEKRIAWMKENRIKP